MKILFTVILSFVSFGAFANGNDFSLDLRRNNDYRVERNDYRVKCKYDRYGNGILWETHTYSYDDALSLARSCCYDRRAESVNIYGDNGFKQIIECR